VPVAIVPQAASTAPAAVPALTAQDIDEDGNVLLPRGQDEQFDDEDHLDPLLDDDPPAAVPGLLKCCARVLLKWSQECFLAQLFTGDS